MQNSGITNHFVLTVLSFLTYFKNNRPAAQMVGR